MHTNDMIYRMNLGLKSNFCCLGARELGAATLATTANLSMRYFGFYERGLLGVICHRVTEIGKILPWRDLPPSYGDWKNTHRRFCRWRDKGVWEKLLQELIDNPEFELLMIDASHIKVHAHGSGARGGNQDMAKTKGGSTPRYIWPWMRMVCRSESLLQKVPRRIVSRLKPVEKAEKAGMKAVIPPRKNRKIQREYDKELYKLRHFVENAFMILKRWRGVATRYAKKTASFLAAVQIRCIAAWVF